MLPPDFAIAPPPLPDGPVLFEHDWRDLAFLHWRIPVDAAAPFMPPGTRPDVFDGWTYVGLIPFELRNAQVLGTAAVPYFGDFLETNVRLYSVDDAGRHGVVFLSLETSRAAITLFARATVRIPYTWSRQRTVVNGSRRSWTTLRRWPQAGLTTSIDVEVGDREPDPHDLAVFLTARWGLHTAWGSRTAWIQNHHAPWELRRARLTGLRDQLVRGAGIPVQGPPDVPTFFSAGVHVRFAAPEFL